MRYPLLLVFVFLPAFVPASVSASEFSVQLGVGNLDFSGDRVPEDGAPVPDATSIEVAAWMSNRLSESLHVDVGFERDAILGNTVLSKLRVSEGPLQVTIGPTFGLLNTGPAPVRAGVAGMLTVDLFDRVYIGGEARETLASLNDPGDYRSGQLAGVLGARIPNARVEARVESRRFEEVTEGGARHRSRNVYGISADVFKDGVPYTVVLDLAYHNREVRLLEGDSSEVDALGSIVLGTTIGVQLSPDVAADIGLDTNLFTFGRRGLAGTDVSDVFLFRTTVGLRITGNRQ